MSDTFTKKASRFLVEFADTLDISESNFDLATKRYETIGEWLKRPESKLREFKPQIYSQGSFRLGTVIRPKTDEDEYDIDLVCQVDISKLDITQAKLKKLFGEELIAYSKAHSMNSKPEEGKRCWTMEYADGIKFHLDILPAVPDDDDFKSKLQQVGIPKEWAIHAIAITDNTNPNYWIISREWEKSNPKGYALWFEEQMKVMARARRLSLVESKKYAAIEDVPAFQLKTPLQRSIQILKRHRDILFADEKENKPISIIISTLAAHAYSNESNQLEALLNIVNEMPNYIQRVYQSAEVGNPVNPSENFAEKWKKEQIKEITFMAWMAKAKFDITRAIESGNLDQLINLMKPSFGGRLIEKAAALTFTAAAPSIITREHEPPHVQIVNPNKPHGIKWNK